MKHLKNYQEIAIDKMVEYTNEILENKSDEKVVLHAPTGSGKTFMMTKYIEKIALEKDNDISFIWLSVGKGNLHEQSYISVKREINDTVKSTLAEKPYFLSRESLAEKEIVFVNWDKLNNKDSNEKWTNYLMKEKEENNFKDVIENTRKLKRKIILIIDESHYAAESKRSLEIIYDIIKPNVILEMSATPKTKNSKYYIYINPKDVVEEEMIKNDVIINKDLEEIYSIESELDSTKLTLLTAYKKRLELKKLYEENNSIVNPLVLIQIPNKDSGQDKKEIIENFMFEHGITYENEKLYAWLDQEEKSNITLKERMKKILPLNSKVEFLIFKQAIDTGWDCPRAQILVKFRETKSTIFSTQTLGRILRMPEAKHYKSDALNTAYVYTNIEKEKMKIEKETYEGTIIKSKMSTRKNSYKNIDLLSYSRNRINQGDIEKEYYSFFENSFISYFDLTSKENLNYKTNILNIVKKGINIDPEITTSLLSDGIIPAENIDKIKANEIIYKNSFGIKTSRDDLQYKFTSIINNNLNNFPPVRSIPTVRQAIFIAFKKLLNITLSKGGAIYIQNLIVGNEEIFSKILDASIKKYKEYKLNKIEDKKNQIESYNPKWNVEEKTYYNPDNIKLDKKLSLHQPLYIRKQTSDKKSYELELDFIDYLEEHSEYINWYWKNRKEPKASNFGIRKSDGYVYRPDYLVSFKNGTIGIFMLKKKGYNEEDINKKLEALYNYAKESRLKGKNIIGALVTKDKDIFKINLNKEYTPIKENNDEWEHFDQLFN